MTAQTNGLNRFSDPSTWRFDFTIRRVELERMIAEIEARQLTIAHLTTARRRWPSRKLEAVLLVAGDRELVADWLRSSGNDDRAPAADR